MYGITDHLFCNYHMKELFQIFFRPDDLTLPESKSSFRLTVRKFHYMNRFELCHQFIHLLFSVTGRLSDHKISKMKKRTSVTDCKSITGFYQRTHTFRQIAFRSRDRLIGKRTKTYRDCSRCHRKFCREIGTIHSYNRNPPILIFFYFQKCFSLFFSKLFKYLW